VFQLNQRIAIVTGASAGIGEAVARELSSSGAALVLNARREDRLKSLASSLKHAVAVAGDCSQDKVIGAMLDAARDTLGGGTREADLVVINAGRGLNGSVMTSDTAQWEEMIRTNLLAAAKLIREAGARMLKSSEGKSGAELVSHPRDIIILGSTVGRNVSPFSSMYGVQGVAGYDPKWVAEVFARIGPVLQPVDIARTIAFIASQPANVHINDVVIRPTRQDYP